MARYALAPHVHACLDDQHVVLLDLKRDRYFSFEAAQARGLGALVAGWPIAPESVDACVEEAHEGDRIARQLVASGLLIRDGGAAAPVPAHAVPRASVELASDRYEDRRSADFGIVTTFLSATLVAAITLRVRSLERAVHRVRSRRTRMGCMSAVFDIDRTRKLIGSFTDLRPLLFTSRDACLFESLVLIEFLAWHHIFPNWVFGVRARPFAAHCWVQHGDTVLNDTLEHLSRYTCIMVV